jgi:hypothetical protein
VEQFFIYLDVKKRGSKSSQRTDSTDLFAGKYMVWFFAGGESRDNKFNVFTGSFISLMKRILSNDFDLVKGIYFDMPARNVAWALNHSQFPIENPNEYRITEAALNQMMYDSFFPDTRLVIVSSSSGSVIAAQVACYLAEKNREWLVLQKPFDLALGATLISRDSLLFKKLLEYQKKGIIGHLIYDELQDEGDSSAGVGDTTRLKAWTNALGLMAPLLSRKYSGPSFLNIHPVKGHLHRRRSQTVRKALDFIDVLLVKYNLAGDHYREIAMKVIEEESARLAANGEPGTPLTI